MLYKVQSVIRSRFKIMDSVTSQSGERIPCIEGFASHTNIPSQKGYRYRDGFWDKIINDPVVQQQIANRDMLGMIEHPDDDGDYMRTPYKKASHVIMRAFMVGEDPKIVVGLLNNEDGNAIKALVDVGHCPGVSTRGLGAQDEDEVSEYISDDGFNLITWDIVRNPNFEDIKLTKVSDSLMSNPLFKEAVQMYQLRDSVDDHFSRESLLKDLASCVKEMQSIHEKLLKL